MAMAVTSGGRRRAAVLAAAAVAGAAVMAGCGSNSSTLASATTVDQLLVRDVDVQVTTTTAQVTWTSRDSTETAVAYGTTPNLGQTTFGTAGTAHLVTLTGLTSNTIYWFKVYGRNTFLRLRTMGGTRTRLAFTSDRADSRNEIYISYEWGENVQRVTTTGAHSPALSTDGTRLAWTTLDATGHNHIWMCAMNTAGAVAGSATQVTNTAGRDDDNATWSPDDSTLVFTASSAGLPAVLMARNVASGVETVLLNNAADNDMASYSYDGTKIAYVSDSRTATVQTGARPIDPNSVSILVAASPVFTLSPSLYQVYDPTDGEIDVSGAGVGGLKIFVSYTTLAGQKVVNEEHGVLVPHQELYRMNADGSGVTRVTTLYRQISTPRWTVDGSSLLFVYDGPSSANIYRCDENGGTLTALTGGGYYDYGPAVSPDGTSFIFSSNRDPDHLIKLFTAVIGQVTYELNIYSSSETQPVWSVIP
jgi:Tol biopolymer transport system component